MKELILTYLATFFIVTLFVSTVPSGLFHVSPQNVLASKNLTEGLWNKNSLQYLNQIHKNKLSLEVLPISDSNSVSHNNTLLSATISRPLISIIETPDHHTLLSIVLPSVLLWVLKSPALLIDTMSHPSQ